MPADPRAVARDQAHTTLEAAQAALETALYITLDERHDLSNGILRGGEHLSDETKEQMIPVRYAGLGLETLRLCRQYVKIWEVINGG